MPIEKGDERKLIENKIKIVIINAFSYQNKNILFK